MSLQTLLKGTFFFARTHARLLFLLQGLCRLTAIRLTEFWGGGGHVGFCPEISKVFKNFSGLNLTTLLFLSLALSLSTQSQRGLMRSFVFLLLPWPVTAPPTPPPKKMRFPSPLSFSLSKLQLSSALEMGKGKGGEESVRRRRRKNKRRREKKGDVANNSHTEMISLLPLLET